MYASIFMDSLETDFRSSIYETICLLKHVDCIFFVWIHGKETVKEFLNLLNDTHSKIKFTHWRSRKQLNFLDDIVKVEEVKFSTNIFIL